MAKKIVHFQDLGLIEYGAAWELQEQLMKQNLQRKADWYASPATDDKPALDTRNYFLLCEHPHVYTIGKSGHMENLLINDARLKELNVSFYKTNRGGDITYHGKGQIVGYPILDLEQFFTDLGKYMRYLEEVIIRVLGHFGIKGDRLPGSTGVWIEPNTARARKICAMGVRSSRWVTMHGFALNVNTDLSYFGHIVPCGIADKAVTSLQAELGRMVDEKQVRELILTAFAEVFGTEMLSSETDMAEAVPLPGRNYEKEHHI